MDQFVKELTETLAQYDEDVILRHVRRSPFPALDVTEDSYDAGDLYQTQYVIWAILTWKREDKDLTTYQLAAEVFDRIGIHTGTTIKYHQTTDHSDADYLNNLKMLGYDMLYGKQHIYGGTNRSSRAA